MFLCDGAKMGFSRAVGLLILIRIAKNRHFYVSSVYMVYMYIYSSVYMALVSSVLSYKFKVEATKAA